MKKTVGIQDFHNAFHSMGRKDNFSYEGRTALFEYLEEEEKMTGREIELDVVALCCDYSEYPSALEAANAYGFEAEEGVEGDDLEEAALDFLRESTEVIEVNGGGVIIQDF